VTTIREPAAHRVMRGVKALDRADPGWWHPGIPGAIDMRTLRIEDPSLCLLTQRYGAAARPVPGDPWGRPNPYATALRYLGIPPGDAEAHGFTGADAERLTVIWLIVITTRRAQGTAGATWEEPS
jgi:hypothetical protein